MPLIRFIRGTVFRGEGQEIGAEHDVTEREAHIMCDGYKDAVRVDGSAPPVVSGMTVRDQITHADPVAEHRDPASKPGTRRKWHGR